MASMIVASMPACITCRAGSANADGSGVSG
jgi:hypothetical protein